MKRPLLVFAGQSNMVGAAVLPPTEQVIHADSYEYLHKPRRFGAERGSFRKQGFPCGEFSYADLGAAYGEGADADSVSELSNYTETAFFTPSMVNLEDLAERRAKPFAVYSEASFIPGPSLAPYLVRELEASGCFSAYAHAAKGCVGIDRYLRGAAAEYFDVKVRDFFSDAEHRFSGDDLSFRALLWLQGENEGVSGDYAYYKRALAELWERARLLGFSHFLIVRVGWWGNDKIAEIMRAQEDFCRETDGAYILTRVLSFFGHPELDSERWFAEVPTEELLGCRDSYLGFKNHHVNEKGFRLIARFAAPNLLRLLRGEAPILEAENVRALL